MGDERRIRKLRLWVKSPVLVYQRKEILQKISKVRFDPQPHQASSIRELFHQCLVVTASECQAMLLVAIVLEVINYCFTWHSSLQNSVTPPAFMTCCQEICWVQMFFLRVLVILDCIVVAMNLERWEPQHLSFESEKVRPRQPNASRPSSGAVQSVQSYAKV